MIFLMTLLTSFSDSCLLFKKASSWFIKLDSPFFLALSNYLTGHCFLARFLEFYAGGEAAIV